MQVLPCASLHEITCSHVCCNRLLAHCLCVCVCVSVCLSDCLSVCLSVCLCYGIPDCADAWWALSLSVCLFVCVCVCLSICLSVCVSVCLQMQLQAEPVVLSAASILNHVVMPQTVLRRAFPFQLMLAQSTLWNVRPQQIRLQIQSDTPVPRQCLSTACQLRLVPCRHSESKAGNIQAS